MTWAERMAEIDRRIKAGQEIIESIRASQHEYDEAERRKQELKARSRRMSAERLARYASFW